MLPEKIQIDIAHFLKSARPLEQIVLNYTLVEEEGGRCHFDDRPNYVINLAINLAKTSIFHINFAVEWYVSWLLTICPTCCVSGKCNA